MNEVLAPIYYVFCQEIDDEEKSKQQHAAAQQAAAQQQPPTPPPSPPEEDDDPLGAVAATTTTTTAAPVSPPPPPPPPPPVTSTPSVESVVDVSETPLTDPLSEGLKQAASTTTAAAAEPLSTPDLTAKFLDVSDTNTNTPSSPPPPPKPQQQQASSSAGNSSSGGTDAAAEQAAAASGPPKPKLTQEMMMALDAVEGDAFFCFTNLMAELRDHFCSKLDHTNVGISAKVKKMERLINAKDAEVGRLLTNLKVSPTFYGFRWITLLMTQEWELPDVLRLWDTLLSDPRRFEFLTYFCVATVLSIRNELLQEDDFAFAVKALQRFDARVPMEHLLRSAHILYAQDFPSHTM